MNELAQILAELQKPLPDGLAVTKDIGQGRPMTYLEGYTVIDQANAIFGHDGWGMQVLSVEFVAVGKGFYTATVRVNVTGWPIKEDVGTCALASETPAGHDTGYKGAVTDAMKRALRQFGNQFGNSLYDPEDPNRQPQQQGRQAPPLSAGAGLQYGQPRQQPVRPPDTRQTVNRPGEGIVERKPIESWNAWLATLSEAKQLEWRNAIIKRANGVPFEDLSTLQQSAALSWIKESYTVRQGSAG